MPKAPRADTLAEEAITSSDVGTLSDVGLAVSKPSVDATTAPVATETEPVAVPPRTHFTPDELAKATGNAEQVKADVRFGGGRPDKELRYSWQHAAAAQLHGWAAHEHHAGAPIALTREDYEAALKAATETVTRLVNKDGSPGEALDAHGCARLNGAKPTVSRYEPHPAALSTHAPKEA
jgi:hypothetical protein